MKQKLKNLFVIQAVLLFLLGGFISCTKNYQGQIDDINDRLSKLENWQKSVNTNISALQSSIKALESNDFVTSVTPLSDGSGYEITFKNSGKITIKNGKDASTSLMGVTLIDGVLYWTVDYNDGKGAQPLLDKDGNKIPTTGKDAIAPQVRINTDSGIWEVSTDGGKTWNSTGVKAQGDSFFKSVTDTDPNFIELVLTDGQVIKMPKYKPFVIGEGDGKDAIVIPHVGEYEISIDMPTGFDIDNYNSISVSVLSDNGISSDILSRVSSNTEKWEVKANEPVLKDGKYTVSVIVNAPDNSKENDNAVLKISITEKDGYENSSSRSLKIVKETKYNAYGEGTEENPYRIYNAEQLVSMSESAVEGDYTFFGFEKFFKLENDIYMNDIEFNPIGKRIGEKTYFFSGTFDGNNHSIHNLNINKADEDFIALFGQLNSATIKNLTLKNVDIKGNIVVGGIAGYSFSTTFENCKVIDGTISSQGKITGGIVGENASGKILSCTNSAHIKGNTLLGQYSNLGGIVGYNFGEIIGCENQGNIECEMKNDENVVGNNVGGIAGFCKIKDDAINTIVKDCRNSGSIKGNANVGGIIGGSNAEIVNCHNEGTVDGYTNVGGVAGVSWNGLFDKVSNSGTIKAKFVVAGIVGHIFNEKRNTEIISVKNSFNSGKIAFRYKEANMNSQLAGIVSIASSSHIENCYNTGEIGDGYYGNTVAGIVNNLSNYNTNMVSKIVGCYNVGDIKAEHNIAGIAHYVGPGYVESTPMNSKTEIIACYNTGNIYGSSTISGIVDVVGKSSSLSSCFNTGKLFGLGDSPRLYYVAHQNKGNIKDVYYTNTEKEESMVDEGTKENITKTHIENLNSKEILDKLNENNSGYVFEKSISIINAPTLRKAE